MTAAANLIATAAHVARASWDAQCTTAVLANGTPQGAEVRCLPMTIGGLRAVRAFHFTVRSDATVPLLLTALGGCVAETAATSLALRGVVPDSLVVVAGCGPAGLSVRLEARGCSTEALAAALAHVRSYSPVHRLLADPGDLRIAGANGPVTAIDLPVAEVTVTWLDGLRSRTNREIDEPHQLAGGDRAPSPLEYLLGALAAESAGSGAEVHVSARRDLRGWFGMPGVPPEPRALLVQATTPGDEPAVGVIAHLVAHAQQVESSSTVLP